MTTTITTAGIDTAKDKLDIAVHGSLRTLKVANDQKGWGKLVRFLKELGIVRAGIEATGGYEQGVTRHLRKAGIDVLVLQPQQVKFYAAFKKIRVKNDKSDARLIAACTSECQSRGIPDERLADLAGDLTFLEQIEEELTAWKCRLENAGNDRVRAEIKAKIKEYSANRDKEISRIINILKTFADLGRRYELVYSVPGIGERTAIAIIIRMPEIGTLSREQAASLAGLAPFDDDSGKRKGPRAIAGGRGRLRRSLYAAAMPAAFHWNPALHDLYGRLTDKGRAHRSALTACARKLLIYANAVVRKDRMWTDTPTAH